MAQLYFTRAKLFLHEVDGAVRRFAATPSAGRPTNAPDWVRETDTYKLGIKDGSITDLTPAAPAPAPTAVEAANMQPPETPAAPAEPGGDASDGKKGGKGGKKDPGAAMGLSA